jgi:hypothetical protein
MNSVPASHRFDDLALPAKQHPSLDCRTGRMLERHGVERV